MKKKIRVTTGSPVKIVLSLEVARMLHAYQKMAETEILLVGKTRIEGQVITVEDAVLLPQSANRASVELDQDAYGDWIETVPDEDLPRYNCWLHTHPGMGVFWSGTDDENIARQDMPLLVSVVADGNTMLGRVDLKEPFPVTINHVPVEIDLDIDGKRYERAGKEIKDKIYSGRLAVCHTGWPFDDREGLLDGWGFIPEDDWDEDSSFDHDRAFEEYIMSEQYGEEETEYESELSKTARHNRSRKVHR